MKKVINYLEPDGRIKIWPSKRTDKVEVLKYLVRQFEYNKFYSEKEVNCIIDKNHSFNDYFLLRRELIDNKLLYRTKNGARYWRGDFIFEKSMDTKRTTLKYYDNQDIEELKEVYISCGYMKEYSGIEHQESYIDRCFCDPELPPEGSSEFIKFRSIKCRETGKVIGLLEYYMGYPNSNTLWIGGLFIHKDYQRMGFAAEVVDEFNNRAKSSGFNNIGIGVYLKNWQAMRFWSGQGFRTIKGIFGDETYGEDKFSVIQLEKSL